MLEKGQRRRYQCVCIVERPVEELKITNRRLTFGAETAGDCDSSQNRDNNGVDGIASSSGIDSERVKEVRLAGECQRVHQGQ